MYHEAIYEHIGPDRDVVGPGVGTDPQIMAWFADTYAQGGASASRADAQGKVTEGFAHIYLSGWAPSENQPRPAKRGSGQVSLADILSKDQAG
jgi:hypothetical protein